MSYWIRYNILLIETSFRVETQPADVLSELVLHNWQFPELSLSQIGQVDHSELLNPRELLPILLRNRTQIMLHKEVNPFSQLCRVVGDKTFDPEVDIVPGRVLVWVNVNGVYDRQMADAFHEFLIL